MAAGNLEGGRGCCSQERLVALCAAMSMSVTHLPTLRKLAELAFCCSPRENSIRVAEVAQSVGAACAASCVLRAGSRRAARQGVGLGRRRRP